MYRSLHRFSLTEQCCFYQLSSLINMCSSGRIFPIDRVSRTYIFAEHRNTIITSQGQVTLRCNSLSNKMKRARKWKGNCVTFVIFIWRYVLSEGWNDWMVNITLVMRSSRGYCLWIRHRYFVISMWFGWGVQLPLL